MATYKDIKRQIAELEKKAEELRKSEAAKIISGIKMQIIKYDLTPADLFEIGSGAATVSPVKTISAPPIVVGDKRRSKVGVKATRPASIPKYMDPKTLKTWTGHGKAPSWIAAAASKGKKDDYLIVNVEKLLSEKVAKSAESRSAAADKKAEKARKPKAVVLPTASKPVTKESAASTRKQVKPAAKKVLAPKKLVVKPKTSLAKQAGAVPETITGGPVMAEPAPETVVAPDVNESV
jgi:DNA-binding protein H-NS